VFTFRSFKFFCPTSQVHESSSTVNDAVIAAIDAMMQPLALRRCRSQSSLMQSSLKQPVVTGAVFADAVGLC
jgi:hypothetical protein